MHFDCEIIRFTWPTGALHAHVCGIHFYSGDMKRQIIAEHYCSRWTDEMLQCDPGADGWQKGQAFQLDLKPVAMSGAAGTSSQP